jgi:membrane protein implicated in regulation of membrane protease activity
VTARIFVLLGGWLLWLAASPAWAQAPYTYMKFSLRVPWTLYFVFLACITIPFAVMIIVAWRDRGPDNAQTQSKARSEHPAGPEQ